jgi:EmrB/QacA subfamily drug resistance transporter
MATAELATTETDVPAQSMKDTIDASGNLKWWILLTVIIGTFLGRLDQTIVNLALPKIINDFSISVSSAGWIATAYILANAVFVPIWGKLGDTIGRKKVYILGFSIFIIGSALAGLSWNLSSMIVFRVIQAIAGSADYPTAMAILAVTFREGKERAQALGIWSSSFAAAAVFGPLIGGPLIDHFSWRAVFLVNIPVGVVGLLMAIVFIHESVSESKTTHFDWWGALTLGAALSTLVLVLDQGTTWGWGSFNSMLCYILTAVFTYIFIRIEQSAKEPIVNLKFFKNAAFVNVLANNFIVFMGLTGSLFLVPIFAQTFLGYDATKAGYLFIPMAAALMLASPLGGSLIGKVSARWVIMASTFVAAIGLYMFSHLDPRSTALDLILPLSVMAFGLGFGMAQRTNIIASVVEQHEIGVASSILALARNIAGAFGIAIFNTILTHTTNNNVAEINAHSFLQNAGAGQYQQYIALIILKAQVMAYNHVFVISALLVFIGAIASYWIRVGQERNDIHVHVE